MRRFRELLRQLRVMIRGRGFERDLDEEMRFHLERRVEEGLRQGISEEQVRRAFGNALRLREESRDEWGIVSVESLLLDLRYGCRKLVRDWRFSAVVLLLLAMSIGANTAVFSVVDYVLLRPLPVAEPGELVAFATPLEGPVPRVDLYPYPFYDALREMTGVFAEIYASAPGRARVRLPGEAGTIHCYWESASENYFAGLGVSAHLGRTFVSEDFERPEGGVAVLSYSFWTSRFGGDPNAIGSKVEINDQPRTVVGVARQGYFGTRVGASVDVWTPMPQSTDPAAPGRMALLARLRPGVSVPRATAAAQLAFTRIKEKEMAKLRSRNPNIPEGAVQEFLSRRIELLPGAKGLSYFRDDYRTPLLVLAAAVGLILLIACSSIAGLLVARGSLRGAETAIRMAIGAGRARVVR
ncbi:MAG: hypothetical protein GY953_23670, partial [bacterium]|nr:hypothetical protein [bacterium]